MKKKLIVFASLITSAAVVTSGYIATLSEPTEMQKGLSNTTNAIALAGTTSIFELLDDDHDDGKKDT